MKGATNERRRNFRNVGKTSWLGELVRVILSGRPWSTITCSTKGYDPQYKIVRTFYCKTKAQFCAKKKSSEF
jgi:hypothetical protein